MAKITRRNRTFELGNMLEWHAQGRGVSTFFNTLSPFFPDGERFFIASVRAFRDRIKDDSLQEEISAFIGQEAFHGREHEKYDLKIDETGFKATAVETAVGIALRHAQVRLPASHALAITIALEHITAILAHVILENPEYVEGDEEAMQMWLWHAMEEDEHKAVAYDVYERTVGSYLLRATYQVIMTAIFVAAVYQVLFYAWYKTKCGPKEWFKFFNFQFGRKGFFWKVAVPWLKFFNPKFHPEK